MRYAIYKKAIIISIIFMSLVSCSVDGGSNFNYGYYVGIISFNKDKKESFINQYDIEGHEENKIKFSLEGMSYLGDFIPSDKYNFYVKSNEIISSRGNSYLIEVDKYTNGYSKINLDLGDIYKISVVDNKIYITHSLNKLSIYDKNLKKINNTIEIDNYIMGKFYIEDDKIYIFSRNGKEKSYLNILNCNTLEVIEKLNITQFGVYQNDMYCYDGKIYFTNYDANSNVNSGKIGVYDIYTKSFDFIKTSSNNLDKIIVSEDNIYVTVRGDNININKDSIIKVNRKTLESSKIEFDYNIKVFDSSGEEIFVLSDKNLEVYSAKDFTPLRSIELNVEPNSVVSGLIVYDY